MFSIAVPEMIHHQVTSSIVPIHVCTRSTPAQRSILAETWEFSVCRVGLTCSARGDTKGGGWRGFCAATPSRPPPYNVTSPHSLTGLTPIFSYSLRTRIRLAAVCGSDSVSGSIPTPSFPSVSSTHTPAESPALNDLHSGSTDHATLGRSRKRTAYASFLGLQRGRCL